MIEGEPASADGQSSLAWKKSLAWLQQTQESVSISGEWEQLPVLLVHGLNARDYTMTETPNWGRIPARLREMGTSVWFSNHDSWNGNDHNAAQIGEAVHQVIAQTGAPALHMIAHSKGGVDARRALYLPGVAEKVFSLTTLATPHLGTRFSTTLAHIPLVVHFVVAPIINAIARTQGDPHPDSWQVLHDTTLKNGRFVEEEYPDLPDIEYRSYAFVAERPHFHLTNPATMVMNMFDGETDGVVPLRSTKQPHRTIVHVVGEQKVTHDEPTDFHKRDIKFVLPNGTVYDGAPDFIASIVESLDADWRATQESFVETAKAS